MRRTGWWTQPFGSLAIIMLGAGNPVLGQDQCGVCHPENRVEFARSQHFQEGVTCADCHLGDGSTLNVDRAHSRGFRSLENRMETPAVCAECHSDLDKMRPFNLPVDQYVMYQGSQHGRAVASGDQRAAVCTDCHGTHDIRQGSNPLSLTHSRNVPSTCGRCHADASLMEQYGLNASVVEQYRSGIHGRALLEAGNAAAPNCTTCHGVHGATPPGIGDIDKVCGSCHDETRRAFLAGPHYRAMLEAELPECASCHSNHGIAHFELDALVRGLCSDCHGADSPQTRVGGKLHTLVQSAGEEIEQASLLVERAERAALPTEDYESRLEEARTYLTEALPLVHTVTVEPVETVTRRARSIAEEVRHEIYEQLDRTEEHLGLVIFWFYLLMTLVILILYKRRLRSESEAR